MKKLSLVFLMVAVAVTALAQPRILFESNSYDFGRIKEEGGKVTGRFEFTNVGDSDLVLTNVRPGCGCTAANYSHEPVAPGAKGFIEATYNPYNRPGAFNKNIRVTTNEPQFRDGSNSAPHMIFIKGEVIKRPPTVFEQAGYTKSKGMARIKEPNFSHNLLNTQTVMDTILVRNFWDKPVSYQLETCEYVTEVSRSFGKELQGGQEGTIILKYDAAKRNAFGQIKDRLYFQTNDSIDPRKDVFFSVNIKEDFSKLSAKQKKNAPVAVLNMKQHDFGNVQKNSQQKIVITLNNNGGSPLLIRNLQTSAVTYKASADITEIPVGGKADITVTLKVSSRTGSQDATLEVITNDPVNSSQIVNLKAKVL